jgi:transcriptional regulator GlxA family with amidase domain
LKVVPLDAAAATIDRLLASVRDEPTESAQRRAIVAGLTRHATRLLDTGDALMRLVAFAAGSREPMTVRALAREVGLGTRRVQVLFRDGVGPSPKQLLRITRYQRALSLRREHARLSWSAIAVRAGYFDQAHLIHESRDIAGCTPNVLLGSEGG